MNKKSNILVILLSIALIGLFWLLVFVGKDEFAEFQRESVNENGMQGEADKDKEGEEGKESEEEAIKSAQRVFDIAGVNMIKLSAATQKNSGITTAKLSNSNIATTSSSTGLVLAIDSLIAAKASMLNISSNDQIARIASQNNRVQYQRLKTLNEDDKNVSDKVVQDALALVNADKGMISTNDIQLKNLQLQVKQEWGDLLAQLTQPMVKLTPNLSALLTRKNVLVQVNLPVDAAAPAIGSTLKLSLVNDVNSITATYVAPAIKSDAIGFKTYYYSAPAEFLRVGMRVNVSSTINAKAGVVIPNNSVVWYGGKAWVYFKSGQDQFVRKAIETETEINGGWVNANIEKNSEVVVSGAQLLLSEEFKSQIKNESE